MFKPKQKVFVASPEQKRKRFDGAYGVVTQVIPAGHRTDEWKDAADLVTVSFDNYDGFLSISEDFNETEIRMEHRRANRDTRPGWHKERRARRGGWFARFRNSGSFVNMGMGDA